MSDVQEETSLNTERVGLTLKGGGIVYEDVLTNNSFTNMTATIL